MALIETKVGDFSISEAFIIGLMKSVSERILTPLIGNGTYLSGATKLVGAYALPKMVKGKYSNMMGTALAVDGVEDIIQKLLSGFGGNSDNGGTI